MNKISALAISIAAICISTSAVAQVSQGHILRAGQTLPAGNWLESKNGIYELHMQPTDGNLVLYRNGPVKTNKLWYPTGWNSGPKGGGTYAKMQEDGNFVMYRNGSPVWATDTGPQPWDLGFRLVLGSDGSLKLYNGQDQVVKQLHIDYSNGGPTFGYFTCTAAGVTSSVSATSGVAALNTARFEGKSLCYLWDIK